MGLKVDLLKNHDWMDVLAVLRGLEAMYSVNGSLHILCDGTPEPASFRIIAKASQSAPSNGGAGRCYCRSAFWPNIFEPTMNETCHRLLLELARDLDPLFDSAK